MAAVDPVGATGPGLHIAIDDDRYPPLLREIHDPPDRLYVRGDPLALARPQVAIVGSRRASSAGLRLAAQLAGDLGEAGLGVCSGLALGVDGAAHRGALDSAAPTLAVMATGIDAVYPRRHRGLAAEIAQRGALVTEFPPGTPPRREHFPQRNRLISGLSLGVLVVEAALSSGSLITARFALEQGREVFALPWSPLHECGAGCLRLLRDGAKMVQSVRDVLEELGPLYSLTQPSGCADAARAVPPGAARELLALVGYEAVALDALLSASGKPADTVMRLLTELELYGAVSRVPGGYIRR
ncbi:MAG: DNA-processing protein DprA [Halioglobus sp.]|nr:DNA-processing protein DprA [Halioglobus sp.]